MTDARIQPARLHRSTLLSKSTVWLPALRAARRSAAFARCERFRGRLSESMPVAAGELAEPAETVPGGDGGHAFAPSRQILPCTAKLKHPQIVRRARIELAPEGQFHRVLGLAQLKAYAGERNLQIAGAHDLFHARDDFPIPASEEGPIPYLLPGPLERLSERPGPKRRDRSLRSNQPARLSAP